MQRGWGEEREGKERVGGGKKGEEEKLGEGKREKWMLATSEGCRNKREKGQKK